MLKIRLQRVGRKNEPSFRLVLGDSKNGPKSGKYLEMLGSFDSRRAEAATFNADRIKYWMSMGAQVSDTVHNLLITRKIIDGKKINVLPLKKPIKKEPTEEEIAAEKAASAPAVEATPAPEATPEPVAEATPAPEPAPAEAPVETPVEAA